MSATIKDLFNKVKAAFSDPVIVPVAATTMIYKTAEGVEISIEIKDPSVTVEPTIGDIVTVAGIAALPGDIVLEDGSILVIGEGGLIAEIKPIEAITQPDAVTELAAPETVAHPATAAQMQSMIAKFAAGTPEERISNLELVCKVLMDSSFGWQIRESEQKATNDQAIAIYKQGLVTTTAQMAKQDNVISGLFDLVEQLTKEPTADPVTLTGTKKDQFDKNSAREKKFENYAQAIKALKTK